MSSRPGGAPPSPPPAKRRATFAGECARDNADDDAIPPHPLGIQPDGMALIGAPSCRPAGLGPLWCALDDRTTLDILSFLPAESLCVVASVSRALYVFAYSDIELWKPVVLRRLGGAFVHLGSWRATFLKSPARAVPPVSVPGFYSDYLFASWMALHAALDVRLRARDTIDRRAAATLSVEEFRSRWEEPGVPLLIEGAASGWPAAREWTREELLRRHGDTVFEAREADMRLADFFAYSDAQRDDAPLYVFDKRFGERAPALLDGYEVPPYFREDLLALGAGPARRPDFRWLLIGPARSGSTMHKDPNHTSAWNACVRGAKKWIFFPPDARPPGVHADEDEEQVTVPLSVAEWFSEFYDDAQRLRPIECVQRPGDVVFVPAQWWHSVYNLEDSVAVTQNYASRSSLPRVLRFLRDRRGQVSGCATPADAATLYEAVREGLARERPALLRAFDEGEEAAERRRALWAPPPASAKPFTLDF